MAKVAVYILALFLQIIQLANSFRWTSPLAKRSPRPMAPPPLQTAATLVRKSRKRGKAVAHGVLRVPLNAQRFDSEQAFIEYQSDDKYDRGEMHISAAVNEGDTLVYRTGSWYVDGVLVGDEDAIPTYEYCRLETIQLVWTHNCEHGVLRGLALDLLEGDDETEQQLSLRTPLDEVQFGPEQIIACISNVVWKPNDEDETGDGEIGTCSIPLQHTMWREKDANAIYDEEYE